MYYVIAQVQHSLRVDHALYQPGAADGGRAHAQAARQLAWLHGRSLCILARPAGNFHTPMTERVNLV